MFAKNKRLCIVLLCVFTVGSCLNVKPLEPSENYTHSWIVDQEQPELYQMFSKLVDKDQFIQFELHCKTNGWLGFGLSPNGDMPGADIAIAWIDQNGKAQLRDTHAVARSEPLVDEMQDWYLIDAQKTDGYTIFKIKRPLKSCDDKNDIEIKKETNYLIFAWNQKIPVNDKWEGHGPNNRIVVDMLLNFKSPDSNVENQIQESENSRKIDFRLNNHKIKAQQTYYFCQLFEMDPYDMDQYLIRIESLITKGNSGLVHHMILHECLPNFDFGDNATFGNECGGIPATTPINVCLGSPIVGMWAIGGKKDFYFPPDTGYPIYKSNKKRVYMIEFHFDNPSASDSRVDSSGIRLYLTSKKRKHEVGLLNIGTGGDYGAIQMPPNMNEISFKSVCYPECSNKFFPQDGITIFTGFLHTHLAGRSVKTQVIRNNQIISNLFNNPKYDFNYQFVTEIEPFKLLKNDSLVIECKYNSMGRKNITFWGFSTQEEMCYSFAYYYPRINDLELCFSTPSRDSIEKFISSLIKDGLLPESVMNNSTDYYEFTTGIGNELKKVTNFDEKLKQKYYEFYSSNPGEQRATCGSLIDPTNSSIVGIIKPFPDAKNAIVEDKRECIKGFPTNRASFLVFSSYISVFCAILAAFLGLKFI